MHILKQFMYVINNVLRRWHVQFTTFFRSVRTARFQRENISLARWIEPCRHGGTAAGVPCNYRRCLMRWWGPLTATLTVALSLSLSLCLSVSIERRKIQSSDRRKRRINSWREIAGVRSRQSRWWMGVEQLRDGGYRGWLWRQWVLMKAGWDADRFSCHCEITSRRVDVACCWWRLMTRRAERYACMVTGQCFCVSWRVKDKLRDRYSNFEVLPLLLLCSHQLIDWLIDWLTLYTRQLIMHDI